MRKGALGIISDGERFLLSVEARQRHPAYGTWRLIGGRVEQDEDPADALRREFLEEIGVKIDIEKHFSVEPATFFEGDIYVYAGGIISGEPKVMNDEIGALRWFTLGEINADDKMDSLSKDVINKFASSRK